MMDSTAISTLLSPPLSLSPSHLNFLQLDDNAFVDGATYCIFDPSSSEYQIVLQGDVAESEEVMAFAFPREQVESTEEEDGNRVFRFDVEPGEAALQFKFASNHEDPLQVKTEPNEQSSRQEHYTFAAHGATEPTPQSVQQQHDPLAIALPTFYNEMTIALSNDSETHETYLPLSFDEASHFLFHGREECVISTDIPTVEPSIFSSSSTSNNSFDSNISNSSVPKRSSSKQKVPMRQHAKEGLMINRKVYKCPYTDCKFWAARGHRFHEHMGTHDTVRPFGCSECSYETNWKSDVKKHIARMIQRNAKDHENAILTRISDKKVDNSRYKEYLIDLAVPCFMYSGRVGEPSRCGSGSKKSKKASNINAPEVNDVDSTTYSDFISSTETSNHSTSTIDVSPSKRMSSARPKKTKLDRQPIIMVTQSEEPEQDASNLSNATHTFHEMNISEVANSLTNNTIFSTSEEEVVTSSDSIVVKEEEMETAEVNEDPTFQGTITTNDGITLKIFSAGAANEQPVAPIKDKNKSTPAKATSKSKSTTSKKSNPNLKLARIWECTSCDFTHSNKFNMLNHMFRFHKLHGISAKPTLSTSPSVPAEHSTTTPMIDTYSQPSQDVIVRKSGENCGNFQQYFLVVENGSKEEHSIRKDVQPDKHDFKCDMCPFVAKDCHDLLQHKDFHGKRDESFSYTCPHCNFKSATRKDMEQHKHLHAQSSGKRVKLNDYSRINLKRSESEKNEAQIVTSTAID